MKHTLWFSKDNRLDYKPVILKPSSVESLRQKRERFKGRHMSEIRETKFKIFRYDPDKDEKPICKM